MVEIERCPKCGANLAMVGRAHRCIPDTRKVTGAIATEDARKTGSGASSGTSGNPSKGTPIDKGSRVNSAAKRGRPRIGENRPKPWLQCKPPMSKTTWYRRQKEQKK